MDDLPGGKSSGTVPNRRNERNPETLHCNTNSVYFSSSHLVAQINSSLLIKNGKVGRSRDRCSIDACRLRGNPSRLHASRLGQEFHSSAADCGNVLLLVWSRNYYASNGGSHSTGSRIPNQSIRCRIPGREVSQI